MCQKAPSAKRCIKTPTKDTTTPLLTSQKAPSAKRCIKTAGRVSPLYTTGSGQKAPSAKRCIKTCGARPRRRRTIPVRKHRAPKGALRLVEGGECSNLTHCRQKAPSAKRCIKTSDVPVVNNHVVRGQKAPSAKRCIKTQNRRASIKVVEGSESTERQKVH